MERIKEKFYYKDLFINLLISFFLSHVFYKITFIDRVFDEFLLINQINLGNIEVILKKKCRKILTNQSRQPFFLMLVSASLIWRYLLK